MKENNFFKKTKARIKRIFNKLKKKDTSFFIVAMCVCLLSTALIWRYTSQNSQERKLAEQQQKEQDLAQENGINTNLDPYNDYVNKVKDEYEKETSDKKSQTTKIDLKTMEVPLVGEVLKEFSLDKLLYFDAIGEWRVHKGLDIKPKDTLMIESAFAGKVEKVSSDELTGTQILIDHGENIKTLYNNLTAAKVKAGDTVEKGQIIGNIGKCNSIESSDGPHLHFELVTEGKNINPSDYITVE